MNTKYFWEKVPCNLGNLILNQILKFTMSEGQLIAIRNNHFNGKFLKLSASTIDLACSKYNLKIKRLIAITLNC